MLARAAVILLVAGVSAAPTDLSAQCGPATPACVKAATAVAKNPQVVVQGGVAAINGANTVIHKAPAAAKAMARGVAAVGGPLEKNSTPAYCRNGACYDSSGRKISGHRGK